MAISNRKRRADTQLIRKDEAAEQTLEQEDDKPYSISEIPTHVVFDILSRLPIKTLFNCRRVCKEWFSLISDPRFAKLHLSRSQVSLLVRSIADKYRNHSRKLRLVDLQMAPYSHPRDARMKLVPKINLPRDPSVAFNIVNSCNGLLCLYEPKTGDPIYVCNPVLGEFITLPKCTNGRILSKSGSAFGFSPMSNQYKVVRSFCSRSDGPPTYKDYYEVEIYTLGEGFWRNIGETPYGIDNSGFDPFVNGALHWFGGYHFPDFIYCFDFGSEQFRAVPGPSEFHPVQFTDYLSLGVIRGCLSICNFSDEDEAAIWVMKDYGVKESWSKTFTIVKMISETKLQDYYEPIMVLEGGKILLQVNLDSLLVYDPDLELYEKISIYGVTSKFLGYAHVPSLISLRDVAKGENWKLCRA